MCVSEWFNELSAQVLQQIRQFSTDAGSSPTEADQRVDSSIGSASAIGQRR